LILPKASENSEPSWFGFAITIKPESGISTQELTMDLNGKGIGILSPDARAINP
jgi:CDP-6-deoxy-D-xylo-4-hexulose-3-dehydrase